MNVLESLPTRIHRLVSLGLTSIALLAQCDRSDPEPPVASTDPPPPIEEATTDSAETAENGVSKLETLTDGVLQAARQGDERAGKTVASEGSAAWDSAKERAVEGAKTLKEKSGPVADAAKSKLNEIWEDSEGAREEARERATELWEASRDQAGKLSKLTQETAAKALETAKEKTQNATELSSEKAIEIWDTAKTEAAPAVEALKEKASDWLRRKAEEEREQP